MDYSKKKDSKDSKKNILMREYTRKKKYKAGKK